jgi:transposase
MGSIVLGKKTVSVYGLASSHDDVIRYIGQTSVGLETRRKWHLSWTINERDKSRRTAWIKSVLRDGHDLKIITVEQDATLHEAEIRWIAHYRGLGADLVNLTNGGDGGIGVPKTEEHKARISAAHTGSKKPWTSIRNSAGKGKPGHPSTPETNRKISIAMTGKPKRGLAERNKQRVWTADMRAKSAASRTDQKLSDDDVRSVLERLKRGETQVSIAKVFGVSFSLISKIKRGKARVQAAEPAVDVDVSAEEQTLD